MAISKLFLISVFLLMPAVWAVDVDQYWGQWHGPADGQACLKTGSAGPQLQLLHSVDVLELTHLDTVPYYGGFYYRSYMYQYGTLLRADDRNIYLKFCRDYKNVHQVLWKIDPEAGTAQLCYPIQYVQGLGNPRGFQFYNDPRGFQSIHVQQFYSLTSNPDSAWDTYRLDNSSVENRFNASHCCLGSRILMGGLAWKNQSNVGASGTSYSWHTGTFLRWDGSAYQTITALTDSFQVLDHAWDENRCVLFILSGRQELVPYASSRYIILDSNGVKIQDSKVYDVHRPIGGTSYKTSSGGTLDTTDVVMKLSLRGDYVYAIERTTFSERQLVRRRISADFQKTDSIVLGSDTLLSNLSYCINDSGLYVQGNDSLTAYSHDLRVLRWKRPIPHRTLYHSPVQGFDYAHGSIESLNQPALVHKILHSLACDTAYLYCVCDSFFRVLDANSGTTLFSHPFTDLPQPVPDKQVPGVAGSVTLLPDYVAVTSANNFSRLWIFKKGTSSLVKRTLSHPFLGVTVLPNPAASNIRISASFSSLADSKTNGKAIVEIYNVRGVRLASFTVSPVALEGGMIWKAERYPNGLYCVRVSHTGKSLSKKFLLSR
ncbi:MAG: T9SS type A sorting domain-containing protein [Fibrobacterota bacterium]